MDAVDRDENFDRYIESLSDKVRKNVTAVKASEHPLPFMLHITKDASGKVYVPRIGDRQAESEDRTVSRITCADTLLGCIIGHGYAVGGFLDPWTDGDRRAEGFRINRLDYEWCLKPNGRLVYDAVATNEHWLVSYSRETREYKPKRAGHFYIRSVTSNFEEHRKALDQYVTIFLEVSEKEGILLTPKKKLEQGYYRVQFRYNNNTTFDSEKNAVARPIDRATFMKREVEVPVLEYARPSYARW